MAKPTMTFALNVWASRARSDDYSDMWIDDPSMTLLSAGLVETFFTDWCVSGGHTYFWFDHKTRAITEGES